jgi:hypothetical protein
LASRLDITADYALERQRPSATLLGQQDEDEDAWIDAYLTRTGTSAREVISTLGLPDVDAYLRAAGLGAQTFAALGFSALQNG